MLSLSPDQLRRQIGALTLEANVLLVRAQHEDMKAHVRSAQRDLDEALALLESEQKTEDQLLRVVVVTTIQLAKHRLQTVEYALRRNGPNSECS